MLKYSAIGILALLVCLGCKKDDASPGSGTTEPLIFHSLEALPDTIYVGNTSTITADCEGDGLSYNWHSDAGDILGSGSQVVFGAPSCCTGNHVIQCTVTDEAGSSSTKTVMVHVVSAS